ncbi:Arc family DNA-binding protein [Providencia rettgeri]|uniref:Arc family DNA-binding protein n=1 Tax=Providencia rettgeri TaxID=587 RepID=A0AAE3CYY3_PRORE|nr:MULTISPECIES: Arc family DNA-binding protein [Providencia]EJD6476715.1 Arc family DNA-binding protein [Providencia rettgeri]ELR5030219.1 Arc family DNA-binding protein [Providencia rettgeri]ELR5064830.1 Arc family DNA-binding protein [Providencia rettgeri]ELR5165036.1 Arc family DNA-binding protein [Providencia rettgeri]MBW3118921.1 Arc family DNA-binding protein [Providencia rettgeri]
MKVRDIAPFGVRMEPSLKEALKKSAKDEGRSLNSEIIQRLIKSLKADGILSA